MSLSDTKVRNAKGREKQYKLMDDLGLYLLVKPNGSRLWRFDYQFNGKRKTLAFGKYPAVSLADARTDRDNARNLLSTGVDPSVQQKLDKITEVANAANTFSVIAEELLAKAALTGRSEATISKKRWYLMDLASDLAKRPISEIKPVEILAVVQRLERRGVHETAVRVLRGIGEVFRLAVVTSRAEFDPTQALKGAVVKPPAVSHAGLTDEKQFGALMSAINEYDGWPVVRLCLKFLALTVARPSEARTMKWTEVDRKKGIWTVPKERTKMRREHIIPLSEQAMAVLDEVAQITDRSPYVFASLRGIKRPLSETAMNSALKRMGYMTEEHVPHGFRTSFSTIMNERLHDPQIIEHCLAHVEKGVRGIYNRAQYVEPRGKLLQTWANLIDQLQSGSTALPEAAE